MTDLTAMGTHRRFRAGPSVPARSEDVSAVGARNPLPVSYAWSAVAVVVVTLIEVATWWLIHGQGVTITGDEPHYVAIALSLAHLDPHLLPEYQRLMSDSVLLTGQAVPGVATHSFVGPHGVVSIHDLGLSILMAPLVAIGGAGSAVLVYQFLVAGALVTLHRSVSSLSGLGRRGQALFALTLAAPAFLISTTQIYPDLLSGLVLALALVEVGGFEQGGFVNRYRSASAGLLLGIAWWLNFKNIVPIAAIVVAIAVIAARQRASWRSLAVLFVPLGALAAARTAYDLYYLGHLFGLPQAPPNLGLDGIASVLALLLDRHQGLFVQMPTLILGLAGALLALRRLPAFSLATAVCGVSVLLINGTYSTVTPDPLAVNGQHVANALGNASFAGRYQWTVLPLLAILVPFLLVRIEASRRWSAIVAVAVAGLWVFEALPVLAGHHSYFNATVSPFTVWDPSLYPNWWGVLGSHLPTFYGFGRSLAVGATWWGVAAELGLGLAVVVLSLQIASNQRRSRLHALIALVVVVVLGGAIVLGPVQVGTFGAQRWPASDFAVVGGLTASSKLSKPVPLSDVGVGTFQLVVDYVIRGPGPVRPVVSVTEGRQAAASPALVTAEFVTPPHLVIGPRTAGGRRPSGWTVRFTSSVPSTLSLRFALSRPTVVRVLGVILTKST